MDNKDVTYVLTDGSVKQLKEEAVKELYRVITDLAKRRAGSCRILRKTL